MTWSTGCCTLCPCSVALTGDERVASQFHPNFGMLALNTARRSASTEAPLCGTLGTLPVPDTGSRTPGAAAPPLSRRGRRCAQGLLPPASGCRVPESGMMHHKAFQGALAASEELSESLDAEHHVVGDFIALFYSPDVRHCRAAALPPTLGMTCPALCSAPNSMAHCALRALKYVYNKSPQKG